MRQYKEQQIIEAFKENKRDILSELYVETFPLILHFIKINNGVEDDARDILQEAFLIVFTKIKNDQLKLTSQFNTYIYSICRNLWLKQLRKQKKVNIRIIDVAQFKDKSYEIDVNKENLLNEQYFMYRSHYHSLTKICQEILSLFLKKKTYAEIAMELNLLSEEYARKKKYRCKETLLKRIKNDPNYKALSE